MQPAVHKKATVGLGLRLISDVLITKGHKPALDLCIVMDDDFLSIIGKDDAASTSLPMLPTRRSPPKPLAESPGSEWAPMRTPSSSLLAATGFEMHTSAPLTPAWRLPSRAGLGVYVAEFDDPELASSWRVVRRPAGRANIGLGLDLPCLAHAELVTTVDAQSSVRPVPGLDLSFLDLDDDAFSCPELSEGSLSSSGSESARSLTSEHDSCSLPETAHPKPRRAHLGLGFDLNGADESPDAAGQSPDSTRSKPTLGFDSPFWAMYAAAMLESPEITP